MTKPSVLFSLLFVLTACTQHDDGGADRKQTMQQEVLIAEATSQVGMPAIKNFRERKLLKDILELRDQEGLTTFTYTFSEYSGKLSFFCDSIGYGIPYATQFTNPTKVEHHSGDHNGGNIVLSQADPNALYSPASAEGTWVMCKDPQGPDVRVVYVEPRIVVSPFRLGDTGKAEVGGAQ